jgi:hypothetical protein
MAATMPMRYIAPDMDAETDHDELRRRLAEVVDGLSPAEREVWSAIQRFVDGQTRAGGSRERAFNIVRNLLRKTRDIQIQKRRALFKIIGPE